MKSMAIPKNRDGKTDLMFVVNKKKITHSIDTNNVISPHRQQSTPDYGCVIRVYVPSQSSAPSICKFININSIEKLDWKQF